MKFRVLTQEEEDALYAEKFPEQYAAEKRRAEWDEKHPRCETCGQFLKKRVVIENPLEIQLGSEKQSKWVSHYVHDYWGGWDHV